MITAIMLPVHRVPQVSRGRMSHAVFAALKGNGLDKASGKFAVERRPN